MTDQYYDNIVELLNQEFSNAKKLNVHPKPRINKTNDLIFSSNLTTVLIIFFKKILANKLYREISVYLAVINIEWNKTAFALSQQCWYIDFNTVATISLKFSPLL